MVVSVWTYGIDGLQWCGNGHGLVAGQYRISGTARALPVVWKKVHDYGIAGGKPTIRQEPMSNQGFTAKHL